jgi:hypothetical protein
MRSSLKFYEYKLFYVQKFFPLFKFRQVDQLLSVFEMRMEEEISKSIITYNINPLKILILMIDIVKNILKSFKINFMRCNKMLENLEERSRNIINSYKSPDELKLILKQNDLFGRDLLWYISEHGIFSILDTKVMDRIIQDFWNSNIDITGSFFEASTTYQILMKSSLTYTKDQEAVRRFYHPQDIQQLRTHIFQYEVWKKSMFIRYLIEASIFTFFALLFQYYISFFNKDIHKMMEAKDLINEWEGHDDKEQFSEYWKVYFHLIEDIKMANDDFIESMLFSLVCFSFPVRTVMIVIFAKRSGRNYKIMNINTILDIALFVGVLTWISRYQYLIAVDNTHIAGLDDKYGYVMHIVQDIQDNIFRFDILLAAVSGMFWLKIIFLMRLTRTFGPMIKIIMSMIYDINTFAIIWGIQLFFFACVGVLIFGELPEYSNIFDALIMLFEASLG